MHSYFSERFDACLIALYTRLHNQPSTLDLKHLFYAYDFVEDMHLKCLSLHRGQLRSFLQTFPYDWSNGFKDFDPMEHDVYTFFIHKIIHLIHVRHVLKRFFRRIRQIKKNGSTGS